MEFTWKEMIAYVAVAGAVIGLLLGLIVLILGIKKGKRGLGIIGFVCVFLSGPITPILSLILVAVFIWLILRKSSEDALETPENVDIS